jgi:RNase P protein component
MREASRVLLREAHDPWDVVVVVRPEAAEQPYQDRLAGLAELLRRAGLLPDKVVTLP